MSGFRSTASLTALFLMTACAASDQNATRAQGAGAGAALGAGLGALIGGDSEDILIGAAVGGLAGFAVGDTVARRKAVYATTEEMIVEERRIVTDKADRTRAYNAGLERELDLLNRDIAALESAIVQGQADQGDRRQLRERVEVDLRQARQRLAEVNQEIDISRQIYQEALRDSEPVDMVEWDRRIRELERRRDNLAVLIGGFEASARRIA